MKKDREQIKKELTQLFLRKHELENELLEVNKKLKEKRDELYEVTIEEFENMERRKNK